MVTHHDNRRRTIQDRLISGLNSILYSIIEPLKLAFARVIYQKNYSDLNGDQLVSVMIPTYNHGQLLIERTLPSIFAQTYQNFEVVIVGDHCADNTPELIAKLNHPKVRFYDLPERGSYPQDIASRWFVAGTKPANKALDLIKGEWITWLDDDDVYTPDHIESLLRFAQEGNYEYVAGLYEEERNGKRVTLGQKSADFPEYGGHSTWLYRSYLRFFKYNINSWRKKWDRPGDIDLQLRMRAAGVRMGVLDRIVAYVLPRPGSSTVGLSAHQINENENTTI